MKINLRKIALATLVMGLLTVAANQSFARESEPRWREHDSYADQRAQHANLRAWREKLAYDQAHHASRKKLAEDDNMIAQIESDNHAGRRW